MMMRTVECANEHSPFLNFPLKNNLDVIDSMRCHKNILKMARASLKTS